MKHTHNHETGLTARSFKRSKKAIAISAAMLSLSAASLTIAAGSKQVLTAVQDQNAMASVVSSQNKFRAVDASRAIKGQYIVVLKDQYINQQANAMSGVSASNAPAAMSHRRQVVQNVSSDLAGMHHAKVTNTYHASIAGFVVQMNHANMQKLAADSRVAFVEQDQMMHVNVTQSGATWGLDRIDQPDLPLNGTYVYTNDGTGVTSYILDTGIASGHSDFGGRVSGGMTAINDGNGTEDCHSHGSHVAGTVGGSTYGVAKNTALVPVRVLDCGGSGSNSGVIDGVDWVAANANHPAVANMSLGGGSSTALDNAVNAAINSGVTFVVAAGNDNADACVGSPNRVPNAITIASSTSSDARSSFSNWGTCIDLFAPGSSITSVSHTGGSSVKSGTSMASPHVAGVAALHLQANPGDTPAQVTSAILANAAANRISDVKGSPNLLLQTEGGSTPPPPPPPPPGGGTLSNGVPVTGLSASAGNDVNYTMDVPSGASNISFNISGGTGDADLYTRFGAAPTDSTYDCRPFLSGNNETCTGTQTGGTYHVRVKAWSTFSGVSLTGSYDEGGGSGPAPVDTGVDNIDIASGAWSRWFLDLEAGHDQMVVTISGGTGDADLYVRFGQQSTTSSYDCRPYLNGNNETCTFNNPQGGEWHYDIRGFTTVNNVDLNITAD